MFLKYTKVFLFASIIQAIIIITTETMHLSSLGAKFTFTQLITHVLKIIIV